MGVPPWPVARVALSRAIGHHWLICELLHDLDDERYPFCSLTAVETYHRKRAMGEATRSVLGDGEGGLL
jgi:hypothetical protein